MIASEQQRAPQEPSSVAIAAMHDDATGSAWREVEPLVARPAVMSVRPSWRPLRRTNARPDHCGPY